MENELGLLVHQVVDIKTALNKLRLGRNLNSKMLDFRRLRIPAAVYVLNLYIQKDEIKLVGSLVIILQKHQMSIFQNNLVQNLIIRFWKWYNIIDSVFLIWRIFADFNFKRIELLSKDVKNLFWLAPGVKCFEFYVFRNSEWFYVLLCEIWVWNTQVVFKKWGNGTSFLFKLQFWGFFINLLLSENRSLGSL